MKINRNVDVLRHIMRYCDEIDEAVSRFGDSLETLKTDTIYKNAVALCILQIGELTTHLSDDFKAEYNEMPWQSIKDMRNIVAHQYGRFDPQKMLETINGDIPALREYCETIVKAYAILEHEALEEPEQGPEMYM